MILYLLIFSWTIGIVLSIIYDITLTYKMGIDITISEIIITFFFGIVLSWFYLIVEFISYKGILKKVILKGKGHASYPENKEALIK